MSFTKVGLMLQQNIPTFANNSDVVTFAGLPDKYSFEFLIYSADATLAEYLAQTTSVSTYQQE